MLMVGDMVEFKPRIRGEWAFGRIVQVMFCNGAWHYDVECDKTGKRHDNVWAVKIEDKIL